MVWPMPRAIHQWNGDMEDPAMAPYLKSVPASDTDQMGSNCHVKVMIIIMQPKEYRMSFKGCSRQGVSFLQFIGKISYGWYLIAGLIGGLRCRIEVALNYCKGVL
eukprot:s720_g2.t1